MMLAARNVALRVNGLRVSEARISHGKKGAKLIITDPLLGEFAVDDRFTFEFLELLHPQEIRLRLPNRGWRKVSLRILIALLRSGTVRVAEESRTPIVRTRPCGQPWQASMYRTEAIFSALPPSAPALPEAPSDRPRLGF